MPDSDLRQRIFDDLIGAFEETCHRTRDEKASLTLDKFIDVTVIDAVDKGADYDVHRDYLLRNFREIGAALEAKASGAAVSRDELIESCETQVNNGQARLAKARERAKAEDDSARFEALSKEGRICDGFTREALKLE